MASKQSKESVDLFKRSGAIAAGPHMKDAKTLLLEFLAAVTHGQDAGALFAEDGALELPFLYSVGIPWRHRGRQASASSKTASLGSIWA
jgi:hypothetical protein